MGSSDSKRARSREAPTGERRKTVRVWLLGGFRVSVGSRTITKDAWRLKKAATLVKILTLAPGHRMHREQVIDHLWPDSATRAASNNLRQVVYGARKVLDPSSNSSERYLSLRDEQLFLCPEGQLWVDVEAFVETAEISRRSRDPATYRSAIDLYAGELLPEDRYEEWAEGRRNELRQLYLALVIELAGLYEGRQEYALAIEELRKATAEEPTLEEAHASLMRLHALSGRPERAIAQYERLRDALQKDIGTRPTEATRRLRDEIAAGRLTMRPPAGPHPQEKQPRTGKHNLPALRTSFVGREREMVEVKRTLAMTRLLTLTGAGGTGKTRLSLEVSRDLLGTYPDGVWLVELAPISDPGLVAQEVANVLGVQERPGQPLTETLVEALAEKVTLLVLDNCEHLVEGAARLVDTLLASCPSLRVLATSREPLGVEGEVLWQVLPLSLPAKADGAPNGEFTLESLMHFEAVRLFVDRARQRLLDFQVTQENVAAVVRVCRKLDGIPLAIELATARMGALAVEQVAQRLEVSLDVLKGNTRGAAPRQRTLMATLDWSHDLLWEDEKVLFRRLSVFAGGWTLEAAEEVCSGGGIEQEDALDLLGGLADKSLVVSEAGWEGEMRYRMLEPIRQYAREKLEESWEANEVHNRHVAFYLALGEEAKSNWHGPEEKTWLNRLESEHDNLRAALSWALGGEDSELGLQLAEASWWFWDARGHLNEGVRWLEEALAKGSDAAPRLRAGALNGLGDILRTQGDLERAEACSEEALLLHEELANPEGISDSLAQLGLVAQFRNDTARATTLLEESLAVAQQVRYQEIIPGNLMGLAWIACDGGDIERAQQIWGKALEMAREKGDQSQVSYLLFFMGYTELARGNQQRATILLEESLTISQRLGGKWIVAVCLGSLGIAATLRGDPASGKALITQGLAINLELGTKADIAENLEGLAETAEMLGEHVRGARLWGAAGAIREAVGHSWSPTERLLHEPQLKAARTRLDENTWEAAFAEGQAMTFEEAVEYALSEVDVSQAGAVDGSGASDDQPLVVLTSREREVALLVARGLTNRQVSTELSISERTAGNHVAKILKKLGLRTRAQIASWVSET